jgi:hypothetical protein
MQRLGHHREVAQPGRRLKGFTKSTEIFIAREPDEAE